jgi:predicted DNA-binding transcriptional regulator AlpA
MRTSYKRRDDAVERNDYPIVLQMKHITAILGFSKSATYELAKDPTFPLLTINKRKIVYRDAFFTWLDGKQAKSG